MHLASKLVQPISMLGIYTRVDGVGMRLLAARRFLSNQPQAQQQKAKKLAAELNRLASKSGPNAGEKTSRSNAVWYTLSGLVVMLGATYAAVPLFKLFCESQGIDINTEFKEMSAEALTRKLSSLSKVSERCIEVKFDATTSNDLQWTFEPAQEAIKVAPGETALAFFKAKNLTDKSIVGVATYTILPYEAGLYFNKIQCFCFEEQRLDAHEQVDMPVFFYIGIFSSVYFVCLFFDYVPCFLFYLILNNYASS